MRALSLLIVCVVQLRLVPSLPLVPYNTGDSGDHSREYFQVIPDTDYPKSSLSSDVKTLDAVVAKISIQDDQEPNSGAKQHGIKPSLVHVSNPTNNPSHSTSHDSRHKQSFASLAKSLVHSGNENRQNYSKNSLNPSISPSTVQSPSSVESKVLQFKQAIANREHILETEKLKLGFNSKVDSDLGSTETEHVMSIEGSSKALQLAVRSSDQRSEDLTTSQMVLTIGTTLVALFGLGLIVGIFCCCAKKQESDENENAEKTQKQTEKNDNNCTQKNKSLADSKKPSEVFNPSDIPAGEKDLDEKLTVKDKIKALDNKLIIGPSPDHIKRLSQFSPTADEIEKRRSQLEPSPKPGERRSYLQPSPNNKRKSQNEISLQDNKAQYSVPDKAPQPKPSEDDEVMMRDKTEHTKTKSTADNLSKSDTQDDVSDKIFDNISTHSALSQPHNPDVVIASDDEDEFGDIQRGTVILKSFQRAKPPRNRSPATRTSKGRIRRPRTVSQDKSQSQSLSQSNSRDTSKDREPASTTPSSISLPLTPGTKSKTSSMDKLLSPGSGSSRDNLDKSTDVPIVPKKPGDLMSKSCDFSDFDSVMNQSVTSIGSDIGGVKKSPISAKYRRNVDSPKSEKKERTESPARSGKNKDSRNESPSRFKKNNKESPVTKRKYKRKEREAENRNSRSEALATDIHEDKEVTESSVTNRLSGIPSNINNIFYLIDPTVKNKCKSVGDMTGDKRKSGDYSKDSQKATKHKAEDSSSQKSDDKSEESVSPVKRERTQSDPYRKSHIDDKSPV